MAARVRVGDVLVAARAPIVPDPTVEYVSIGVRSFGKGIFHYEPQPGDKLGSLRFFDVVPGRLVVSNIKGWEGAIAVASDADAGCVASNRFLQYVPRDDRVDVPWASWFFLSERGIELIQRASPGSADRNRTLAIDRFEALEIPLPPIDEQRRVAAQLDHVRNTAAELSELSNHASTIASALAVSATARPDLDDAAKASAGWVRVRLADVMAPARDQVVVAAGTSYPNIGIFSFGRGLFAKADIEGSATSAKALNRVHAGQFIYSRLFAFEGAYAYVPPEFDGFFVSNEFPAFDVDQDRLDARWLASYLRAPERWAELRGSSKGLGVRRQRIPLEAVLAYEVWLPPPADQATAVSRLARIDEVNKMRSAATERIEALLPAALNDAFAGLN